MKAKLLMTMAAATMLLAGCGNDENESVNCGPVKLRLTSGVEVQTRATHDMDTQLPDNEQIHVWVDDAKDTQLIVGKENLYENNMLTADGNGNLTGDPMYFPQTGNAVNIYALHTNATLSGKTFPTTKLTHTVAADQRSSVTTTGAGYQGSDLTWAKIAPQARTKSNVLLTFEHLLSKVEIILKTGNGSPTISQMEITGTQPSAEFTPSKTEDLAVTATGAATSIETDHDVTTGGDVLNEAVIVPQALPQGTKFIRLTTTDGGTLTWSLDKSTTFEAGKKYHYTVTANLTGLTVTSNITDWMSTASVTGNAEMQ